MSSDITGANTQTRRGRGRPTVLVGEAVVTAAFELWNEKGFAETSWADLAAATGVSTRTLMRHYSSKHEIAWQGVMPATKRLRTALAATPDTVPTATAIRRAIVESVTHRPQMSTLSVAWLTLITTEPELAVMAPRAHRPWIEELAAFLATRLPDAPAPVCRALAATYESAAFAALTEWAADGAVGDPADAVDAVLQWIDIAAVPPAPPTPPTNRCN